MTRPIRPPGNTAARGTESSRRPAVGPIPGRGQPVEPTFGNLNRNPGLAPDWLRPTRNALARTKSAT